MGHEDAAVRLKAKEDIVLEYQCLLDKAISDKLKLQQERVETCGLEIVEAEGGAGGKRVLDTIVEGGIEMALDTDRQCKFSHRLPLEMRMQSRRTERCKVCAQGDAATRCED